MRTARFSSGAPFPSGGAASSMDLRVVDLMTQEVVTLDRNDEIALADDLLSLGRVRHIPVLDEGRRLAGIITQRDLFRSALLQVLGTGRIAHNRIPRGIRIKSVMTSDVVTVTPSTPIHEAAAIMTKQKLGCLPVLDGEDLVGILTEADFVSAFVGVRDA